MMRYHIQIYQCINILYISIIQRCWMLQAFVSWHVVICSYPQAWLKAKNEEYHERKRLQSSAAGEDKGKKEQAAKEAYDNWLQEKAKQRKQERVLERRKLEDEASSFIIRERQACEEAFKRFVFCFTTNYHD